MHKSCFAAWTDCFANYLFLKFGFGSCFERVMKVFSGRFYG